MAAELRQPSTSDNAAELSRPSTSDDAAELRQPSTSDDAADTERMAGVDLGKIAWLVTVLACLIAVTVLVLEGYFGYALVTLAVASAAGINLR